MRDRGNIEELSGTISRGLLAGGVVVAIDKRLHEQDLSPEDVQAMRSGRTLLASLEDPEIAPTRPSRARGVVSSRSLLDAMHAARLQAPEEPFQEVLRRLRSALDDAIEGDLAAAERPYLESARSLFAYIAQLNLARVNELTRASRDLPKWRSRFSSTS